MTSSNPTAFQRSWSHAAFFTILALSVCALTVPRLLINYGMDGDGIRGMIAGKGLIETGVYIPSRLPGNPLFEYFLAVVSLLDGHVLANLLVLAFYGLSIGAFWKIAGDRDHPLLLVALFALTPILLVNAVTAKDYVASLAILLWCYVCARSGQYLAAYLLLGLAIGFRLPNAVFAIPLGVFLLLKERRLSDIILFTGLSALMGLAIYAPVFLVSGTGILAIPPHAYQGFSYVMVTGYRLIMVFGLFASVAIVVVLAINSRRIISVVRENLLAPDPEYYLEAVSVIVLFALFLRHSDRSEYLIPAIPFFYLLLWRWIPAKQLVVLSVFIVSFAFVSVELRGGESGRRAITFKPGWGVVIKDFQDRRELEALKSGIDAMNQPGKSVVVHGFGPVLGFENTKLVNASIREISQNLSESGISEHGFVHRLKEAPTFFVSGLSLQNVKQLQQEGYHVFYFSESAPSHCMHTYRYDPGSAGLTKLDIFNDNAFYRKATARNRTTY